MISARKMSMGLGLPAFAAIAALTVGLVPGVAGAASTPGPAAKWAVGSYEAHATAATAATAAVPPPAAGVAPGIAWNGTGNPALLFYTGSDRHAYFAPLTHPTAASPAGGNLIGGPGPVFVPPGALGGTTGGTLVFGRGTNNALYVSGGPGSWNSLGGKLASRPGAAAGALGSTETIDVVVRGADGGAWLDHLTTTTRWLNLGGRVLAGTAPAAVNTGGTLYVLVVGSNHGVWVKRTTDGSHWSGWTSLGGRLGAELGAATPSAGAGIVYARGGDNALWYNEFAGATAGWHSAGGRITSGAGAGSVGNGTGPTWAVALATDGHIWANSGVWPAHAWSKAL